MKVGDIGPVLSNLVRALANRLTAEDNWGPEGEKFQVLTSRGQRDVDPPPTFMDLGDILQGISSQNGGQGVPGLEGLQGPQGPPGEDGANGMVPTFIAPGEKFTIPTNKQALWSYPIDVQGTLDVEGVFVHVDPAGGGGLFGDVDGGEADSVYGGGFPVDGGGI